MSAANSIVGMFHKDKGADNNLPLVSIIVPCYNHQRFIRECIYSILDQTYRNFELIVIDDGSTDQSAAILRELNKESNFRLVCQENRGLAATLNRGISEFCNGKYITFCASDDFWCTDKLEKQVSFMELNPNIPMCFGKTYCVDMESQVIENLKRRNNRLRGGYIFDDLFLFKFHPPVNYFFRREVYDEVGLYDENIYAEDYFMNLKIASRYPIGYIDEYLGFYRVDDDINKIIRFDKVSDSHLMTIEGYKTHVLYERAKQKVFLRKFYVFAPFRRYKQLAFANLIKSLSSFYDKRFIAAFLRFIFLWH